MKIGILETDQLNDSVRKSFGRYGKQFEEMFHSVDSNLNFEYFDIIEPQYPANIDQCDTYFITGSQFSAYVDFD